MSLEYMFSRNLNVRSLKQFPQAEFLRCDLRHDNKLIDEKTAIVRYNMHILPSVMTVEILPRSFLPTNGEFLDLE